MLLWSPHSLDGEPFFQLEQLLAAWAVYAFETQFTVLGWFLCAVLDCVQRFLQEARLPDSFSFKIFSPLLAMDFHLLFSG